MQEGKNVKNSYESKPGKKKRGATVIRSSTRKLREKRSEM